MVSNTKIDIVTVKANSPKYSTLGIFFKFAGWQDNLIQFII
jgi:hypothetical protein